MLDFTLRKHIELCLFLKTSRYQFLTVQKYIEKSQKKKLFSKKYVIIRHDVDRWIKNAHIMAEAEEKIGVNSTYYFRYPGTFSPKIIKQISDLGHEVGYHYEVLSKNNGDEIDAIKQFQEEIEIFRTYVPIKTICMHGNPLSRYDNRTIWNKYRYEDYALLGEAYLSLPGNNYFTDTGRTWSGERAIYDKMNDEQLNTKIKSTDDLISWISNTSPSHLYLTIHPERWAPNPWRYLISWNVDIVVNIGKRLFRPIFSA